MAERKKTPPTIEELIDDPARSDFVGRFVERYKFEAEKGHIKPVGIFGLYALKNTDTKNVTLNAVYDPNTTDNFTVQTLVDTVKQRAVPIIDERILIGYVSPTIKEHFEILKKNRKIKALKLT